MTMIELVVAMALMAVALLALAASFPYAMYAVAASGMQTAATLLAQQAIERAQNAEYRSLARLSFDGSSGPCPPPAAAATFGRSPRSPGSPAAWPFSRVSRLAR